MIDALRDEELAILHGIDRGTMKKRMEEDWKTKGIAYPELPGMTPITATVRPAG